MSPATYLPMSDGLKPCPHRQVDDGGRILCGLIRSGDREVSVNLCRACPVPQINCQHLRASMQKQVSTPLTVRYATGRVEVWNDEAPTVNFKRAACAEKTMPINTPRDCVGCPLRVPVVVPQSAVQVARHNKPAVQPPPQPAAQALIPTVGSQVERLPVRTPAEASTRHNIGAGGTAVIPPSNPPASAQRSPRAARAAARANARGKSMPDLAAPAVLTAKAESSVPSLAESEAAQELVRRAQALAADKYREARRAAAANTSLSAQSASGANKSKIILLQQWLADQFNKKSPEAQPTAMGPDEDGVQEIVYSPIAPVYNEESGSERCVGWTD